MSKTDVFGKRSPVEGPVEGTGAGFGKGDTRHYGENRIVKMNSVWQSFLWAPFNRPVGTDDESRPSPWTAVTALVLNFLVALVYGWFFVSFLDLVLTAAVPIGVQAFALALFASVFYVGFMYAWTYESLLPTQLSFGILFSQVLQLNDTLGILPFLLIWGIQLAGYAAGGAIAKSLGLTNGLAESVMPVATTTGHWMYWFGGFVIITTCMMIQSFYQKTEFPVNTRTERNRRSIILTGLMIFGTMFIFRITGNYYFDGGLYFAGGVATGLWDPTADDVVDWAFYILVPLASAATWNIVYWLIYWLNNASDNYDSKNVAGRVSMRIHY